VLNGATWEDSHVGTPAEGPARLRAAADSGVLDELCERHAIRVLTVYSDLEVGVLGAREPALVDAELVAITGTTAVRLVPLESEAPHVREIALIGARHVVRTEPGALAAAQVAAMAERIDAVGLGGGGRRPGERRRARGARDLDLAWIGQRLLVLRSVLAQLDGLSLAPDPTVVHAAERLLMLPVDLAFAVHAHAAAALLGAAPASREAALDLAVEIGVIRADLAPALVPTVAVRDRLLLAEQVDLSSARSLVSGGYAEYLGQATRWMSSR
jgi:uncharacterized protein YutE (UPF0331/DUF86 family)